MNKLKEYKEILFLILIIWIIFLLSQAFSYYGYQDISKGLRYSMIFIVIWLAYRSNKIINRKKRKIFNSMFDEPKSEIKDNIDNN